MEDRTEVLEQMNDGLTRLKRALHVYAHEHMGDTGLPPAQLGILRTIRCSEPISHKQLGQKLQLTAGAVSQLIDALDEAKLITRTVSQADRRVNYVAVSRSGEKVLATYNAFRKRLITEATDMRTTTELANYVMVQQTLIDWLEANTTK